MCIEGGLILGLVQGAKQSSCFRPVGCAKTLLLASDTVLRVVTATSASSIQSELLLQNLFVGCEAKANGSEDKRIRFDSMGVSDTTFLLSIFPVYPTLSESYFVYRLHTLH